MSNPPRSNPPQFNRPMPGIPANMIPRRSNAGQKLAARVVALLLLLGIGAWIFFASGTPAVTEVEVRRMVEDGELVGITPVRAAERLQQKLPEPDAQGIIRLRFRDISTWTSGPLELEVRDGLVTSAALPKIGAGTPSVPK